MVARFLKLFQWNIVSLNQTAFLLAIFSLLSQLLGLVRDRLLASMVGPSASLDVYYAAFRVPDFLYNSFGVLFSVTVLIPFISDCLHRESRGAPRALRTFLDSIFTLYLSGMLVISLVLIIIMPWLTHVTAPGLNGAAHTSLVLYSRIMLISPFLFGLTSLLSSFAQVQKKFFSFAIAPVLYNVGILSGIVFLLPHFGMLGVVLGVAIGALLYFLIQLPTLVRIGAIPSLTRSIDWNTMGKVVLTSLPRTLGSSLSNLTFLGLAAIASLLAVGSISIFQFSYNIENTPLLIFGISYAVAAFPVMSKLFASGEHKELMHVLYRTTRNLFFFTVPVALLMIVLRAHVVRLILGAGQFSWNDTRLVAASVALFCISITAQSMVLLLVRAFFAAGDTKSPLRINIGATISTAVAAFALVYGYYHMAGMRYFVESLLRIDDVGGGSVVLLALAFSIGQIGNAIVLWNRFHSRMNVAKGETKVLRRTLSHIVGAGIIAAAVAYGVLVLIGGSVDQTHFWGILVQGAFATFAGLGAYAGVLFALNNEDIKLFLGTIRSKFWKQKPAIVQEQQEL